MDEKVRQDDKRFLMITKLELQALSLAALGKVLEDNKGHLYDGEFGVILVNMVMSVILYMKKN